MKILDVSSRSVCVLLDAEGDYYAKAPCELELNGQKLGSREESVASLFGLWPESEYALRASWPDGKQDTVCFRTLPEAVSLDVRRFGAAGDGLAEDTAALQAAILCCPPGGRVMIPEGNYLTGPLFLKSHITLEIKKGAVLSPLTDRTRFPILPGATRTPDEQGEYLLGTWEGNPLDMFAAALTGIGVEDVRIIGEGVIDGRAQQGDWWEHHHDKRGAWRGRMLYLRNCRQVTVQGITFRNSPSWNLHPCFSEELSFLNVRVEAPKVSPNTDGFDPESCRNVRAYGTVFSVGDDCIAIKSGKIYMGRAYHTPCEEIEIAWCLMLDGHGGVTIGSEMAGGVRHVRVHHCRMQGNDRGLRIKTRRGRGKYAVVDDIRFEDVVMEDVKTPLVINSMYSCDPDGKTAYVQSRERQPVDDTTPTVGSIAYERVHATGCSACVGFVLGLPERPVREVAMRECEFRFRSDAEEMVPAMAEGVLPCRRQGVIARFVERLMLRDVRIEGIDAPRLIAQDVAVLEDQEAE